MEQPKLFIENWQTPDKDYMFYANLVNPTDGGKRLNLVTEITGNRLTFYGPEDRLDILRERLMKAGIAMLF